ncbi:MAG: bifunctional YncE family protein/alkaline phosphatase family protein [Acidimicrobiaceae bacterium]|nr:bifunctional YncE family protein/alkaline phosphatase family protein [Acidimicrobiaceae bacterium]
MSFFGGMRGIRRRISRWLVLSAVLAVGASTVAYWAPSAASAAHVGRGAEPPPIPRGATLLPDGRFVRPAGRQYNLGDFSLGLAIAPNSRCAATTDEGWGNGNPVPAVAGVNPAGSEPDEGVTALNLLTGASQFVTINKKPAQNFMGIGLAYNHDGTRLYATSGGTDAVYQFNVGADCRLTYAATVNLPAQAPPPGFLVGSSAAYDRGLAVAADGTVLVTTEYGRALNAVSVDASGNLTTARVAVRFGTPVIVPHSTNTENLVNPPTPNDVNPSYLYAVATATNPATGTERAYITSEGTGQLISADSDGAGNWTKGPTATVGDHPTGLTVSPDGREVMVADANSDQVSVVGVNTDGTLAPAVNITLHGAPGEATGSSPDAVAYDGDSRAYVALAGDDAVAVLDRGSAGWHVDGYVPTGWYPTAVGVDARDHSVLAVSAKGLGSRYPARDPSDPYPIPFAAMFGGSPSLLPNSTFPQTDPQVQLQGLNYNDKGNMPSLLSRFLVSGPGVNSRSHFPVERLSSDSALVAQAILRSGINYRSPNNPIPDVAQAGQSPIKHVLYIVRENRTYDQVFGDLGKTRNDVNADPAYQFLAAATPQAHAVVGQFASSDNFFSDGEASVQGHWWTTSANVTDWIEKAWRLNYSNRNRSQDFLSPVAEPERCSLFQSALAKQNQSGGAFTLRNYGEFYGAVTPDANGLPVSSACSPFLGPNPNPTYTGPFYNDTTQESCGGANPPAGCFELNLLLSAGNFPIYSYTDLGYPNAVNGDANLSVDDRLGAAEFLKDIGLNADGSPAAAGPANGHGLASFNYMVLPEDHTSGLSATFTPRAEVAQNDAALGEILSALSHSSYWSSTAVFVVEDDSQDGVDHVDGHRNILLVASPYTKHVSANGEYGGYIGHQRYDQASVIRTMELILGLPALSSYDQNARPLYDLFQNKDQASELTSADLKPFNSVPVPPFIDERVADLPQTAATKALERQSQAMPKGEDTQGPMLEQVDWEATTNRPVPAALRQEVAKAASVKAPSVNAGDG